ncbi:type IV secretion protein DotU [Enterobacter roggenkampii]|uniref:DotU family type IV/VI secretion system protein n=1 Tax=Enterobacter TaxID=547 RepID=UPI0005F93F28|nr:DotU family type IV/VI secretion system protein [Enterobacter mori]KJX01429.1 type IV secretion protein DotU [Enterobacter roggenkampii]MCG5129788.1 DotU family type IV/VI secretion system protein [Enterobacter mori]
MALLDHYLPVFKQILQMTGNPEQYEDYEKSRHDCIVLLEQATDNARQQDVGEEEKEAARVAVIAWLDETILRSDLSWRQSWQGELLQRKYLNITVAGELFFTRLNQLDPLHIQAREIFLFCLQQGFQGQYSSPDDKSALKAVISGQRQLCLPEAWQTWPNDAAIVPIPPAPENNLTRRLAPVLTLFAGIVLQYVFLYFYLLHYMP